MLAIDHLLARLDEIAPLERVRFITSHPNFFQNDFWNRVKSLRTFCPYIHVPAQSGSNKVLKRMKRLYKVEDYRQMAYEWLSRGDRCFMAVKDGEPVGLIDVMFVSFATMLIQKLEQVVSFINNVFMEAPRLQ